MSETLRFDSYDPLLYLALGPYAFYGTKSLTSIKMNNGWFLHQYESTFRDYTKGVSKKAFKGAGRSRGKCLTVYMRNYSSSSFNSKMAKKRLIKRGLSKAAKVKFMKIR